MEEGILPENNSPGETEKASETINLSRIYARRAKGLPPKDSWLLLADKVTLTAEIEKAWLTKAKEFRKVRGNFLVGCFEIEYGVDQIISEVLFPASEKVTGGKQTEDNISTQAESLESKKELFENLFLKSADNLFGRKIAILKSLSDELPPLKKLITKDLIERLRKVMDIRNVFAHYPIVFIQYEGNLHALLIRGENPIELDQPFFDKHKKLFSSVGSELEVILQQIKEEDTFKTGAGKKFEGWRIFIGHADLNIKEWMLE